MKTVNSDVCGVASIKRTLFLERDVVVEFLKNNIPPQTKVHSLSLICGVSRNVRGGDLKIQTSELSAWLEP